jgi:DNA-binding XRE family transcriptional regulator
MPLTKATGPGGRPRRESEQPAIPFAAWLAKSKLTAEQLAVSLDVAPSSIYNMRNGYFTPGRELAVKIAAVSKGKVPADSWPPARPRPTSKQTTTRRR